MATAPKDPDPKTIHAHDVFDVMAAARLLSFAKRDQKAVTEAIKKAEAVFAKCRRLKVSK